MSQAQAVATIDNPFAATRVAPANAVAEAGSQREVAEVQAAMMIAKRFPRDQLAAMDRILQACTRPSLAEAALYEYAKGGSNVTGPSIRMAEALAQNWGNMQFGIRELDQRGGESTVEAFAWDVETNTRQVKVFQVPHIRHTRRGTYKLEDPREVYELVANQGARRLRACILGVIPGDVIDAAVRQCEVTMQTKADCSPERVKAMCEKFAEFGVTPAMIEKRIQRRLDAITPAAMVNLGKVYNSLRDGMSSASDWFEAVETAASSDAAPATSGERLKSAAMRAAGKPLSDLAATEPKATAEAVPEQEPTAPLMTYAEIDGRMHRAKTQDERDAALDLVGLIKDPGQRGELKALYAKLSAAQDAGKRAPREKF